MADDNIIQVEFGSDPNAPSLLPKSRAWSKRCKHERVLVDEDDREVECATCHKLVDPFVVLARLAKNEMKLQWTQAALAALAKRVGELQDEERRVKARIKRAEAQP